MPRCQDNPINLAIIAALYQKMEFPLSPATTSVQVRVLPWALVGFVFLFPRHLDFFEMVRNEDDLELAKRFDVVSCLSGSWSCQRLNICFGCWMQKPATFPSCHQGTVLAAEGMMDILSLLFLLYRIGIVHVNNENIKHWYVTREMVAI